MLKIRYTFLNEIILTKPSLLKYYLVTVQQLVIWTIILKLIKNNNINMGDNCPCLVNVVIN